MSDQSTPPPVLTRDTFDRGMARAMEDVSVPAGLVTRLQAAVSDTPAQPMSDPSRYDAGTRWARRLLLSGCAAVALLAAWSSLTPRGFVVTEADIRRLAELDLKSLTLAPTETRRVLPVGWQSVRGLELANRLVVASGDSPTVQMLPLSYQADRRPPRVTGLLLPLHESDWPVTIATGPFFAAEIRYTTAGTWVVWREGTTVFVLMLRGDARVMERLQQAAAKLPNLT